MEFDQYNSDATSIAEFQMMNGLRRRILKEDSTSHTHIPDLNAALICMDDSQSVHSINNK